MTIRSARLFCVAVLVAVGTAGCQDESVEPPQQTVRFLAWTQPGRFVTQVSEHFNATIPGVQVVPEPTPGSFFVVSALQTGRGELGLAQADVVYLAYRRGVEPHLTPHTELRAIAVLWVNSIFVVVRQDTSIRTIRDLRGQKVGVVLQGSSGELLTRLLLNAYSLSYADLKPQFYAVEHLAEKLKTGQIDVAIATGATLISSLAELSRTRQVRLLPVEREVSHRLRAGYPFIKLMRIPARELPGRQEDLETVGADGVLLCRKDLSESLVHALTQEFFTVLPRLADDPIAAAIDPERAAATPIPLHPGAARYYREREVLR